MSKDLYWTYNKSSDSYDLHFYSFGEETIIATISDIGDGWEYDSETLGVDNDFLDADNMEDAQVEMLDLIEDYYEDQANMYDNLLGKFREAKGSE